MMKKFRSNSCVFSAAQYRFECLYQEVAAPLVFKANLCALVMQFMTVLLSLDAKIVRQAYKFVSIILV